MAAAAAADAEVQAAIDQQQQGDAYTEGGYTEDGDEGEEEGAEEVPAADEAGYTTAGVTSGEDDEDGGDYFAQGLDVDHLLQVCVCVVWV